MAHKFVLTLALLLILLKLFTVEISYRDDPTVGVVLRTVPSWTNEMVLAGHTPGLIYLAGPDESYVGERLYRLAVPHGWIAALALWLVLIWKSRGPLG